MTNETVSSPTGVSTRARMKLPSLHNSPWIGTLFYCGVLLTAAIGSSLAAVHWLGWPLVFAVPVILLGELAGVYLLQIADQRRRLGEQAYAARFLSAAVAGGMVALNWFGHPDNLLQAGLFAGASALGYGVWVIRSGGRRRDQLRADGRLGEAPPVYGLWRWIRHPLATAEARQIAQQYPDMGLYGSLEVVRLRPVIKPWLRKILTEVHGKESAAFMIAIMDAKGMADMVRDLIRFDVIAVALAHTINAPYLTGSAASITGAPAAPASPTLDALKAIVGSPEQATAPAVADQPDGPAPAGSNGHRPAAATAGPASSGGVSERVPSTAVPARERTSKARTARRPAPERYSKSTDEQRIERLRELARESLDGKVGVREAARELRSGPDTARRLLQIAGLYRDSDDGQ